MSKFRFLLPVSIITVLLLKSSLMFSGNFPFSYERIMVDFNGVAFNQSSIICYGDGGIILRSTDRGNKWSQLKIAPDVYTINKIINKGNYYFGILDSNYLIYSKDDGKKWKLEQIENEHAYLDLDSDSSNIYFLAPDKISVYDFDLKKVKEFTINSTWNAKSIKLLNNQAILAGDSSRIMMIDLSCSGKYQIIDFYQLMQNKIFETPSQIKVYDNNIYVRISYELFKSSDFGNSWVKLNFNIGYFEIFDNSTYTITSKVDDIKNISFVEFYKVDSTGFKRLNSDKITRYVTSQDYTDFKFINSDTIIAVGKDKLINMSFDGGKTWDFKCNLRSVNYRFSNWFNDSLGYFYTDKYQISKTTDGGVTWLPQKYNYQKKQFNILEFSTPDTWYIDDEGNNILYLKAKIQKQDNFLYSKDFGENYSTLSNSTLIGYNDDNYQPSIIKMDTTFLLFHCVKGIKSVYTMVAELDNNLSVVNKLFLDSISIIYAKKTDKKDEIMAVGIEKKYPNDSDGFDSVSFYTMYSYDYTRTWKKEFKFFINYQYSMDVSEIDGFLLFNSYVQDSTNPKKYISSIDILDLNGKKFYPQSFRDTIFIKTYFKLDDNIYGTTYRNSLLKNSEFGKNPYNWQIERNIPFETLSAYFSNNKIAYCVAGYDQTYGNLYKFKPLVPDNVEEEISDYPVYFYSMKPYPVPAENSISCHIYSTIDFSLESASVSVYDIFGSKAAEKSQIIMNRFSSWEWDLKWNCSLETNGIYLIVFKQGSSVFTVPVVVQR